MSELVKVNNGGAGGVLELDPTANLASVRTTLEGQTSPLMTAEQAFIVSGDALEKSDEATVVLSKALVSQTNGPPVLTVGSPSTVIPSNTTWQNLTAAEQVAVLNQVVQITKGLTIGDSGGGAATVDNATMFKTTYDALAPVQAGWVTSDVPRIQTSVTTNSYFSKFAESMATSSSNSASVSVSVPFGGGEGSFNEAQSQSSSSSSVSTYSVGTYNVNLSNVTLDTAQIVLSSNFQSTLNDVFNCKTPADQFVAIVDALNKFGWYVPVQFVLGGVLYTQQSSVSSSWSDAQTQSESFGASFQGSFDGIGGGAAYNNADTSGTTTSGSSGSTSLTFTAIGGTPADANDYATWSASMSDANNWNVSSYLTLVPSIFFLHNMVSPNNQMLYAILGLIAEQYAICPELQTLQPVINCAGYVSEVKALLPSD